MKNFKRVLLTLVSAMLLVTLTIAGTVAYLTDTSSEVKNTFTVGSVAITLDEADVDLYGDVEVDENGDPLPRVTANEYKLLPGHNYTKDPIVHVTAGSEPCWLFVKVVNEIAVIEADTTIAAQMATNGWARIADDSDIWYYKDIVNALNATEEDPADVPVFGAFTLKTDANVADYDGKTITIQAYAVQADGLDTAADAWAAAPLAAWQPTT